VNDALAVFVIGSVDLIDFPHVRLARVPRQHFPVVVDYALQGVLGRAQQLRPQDDKLVYRKLYKFPDTLSRGRGDAAGNTLHLNGHVVVLSFGVMITVCLLML